MDQIVELANYAKANNPLSLEYLRAVLKNSTPLILDIIHLIESYVVDNSLPLLLYVKEPTFILYYYRSLGDYERISQYYNDVAKQEKYKQNRFNFLFFDCEKYDCQLDIHPETHPGALHLLYQDKMIC